MWLMKGLIYGTLLFLALTVLYVYFGVPKSGGAMGLSALKAITIQQPLFWLVFLLVVGACCFFFRTFQSAQN